MQDVLPTMVLKSLGYSLKARLWYLSFRLQSLSIGLIFLKGAFGISISPKMLTVHGRLLSAPRIQYQEPRMPDHAEWNLLGNHFNENALMPRWAVLYFGRDKLPNSATRKFQEILEACGMTFTRPVESYHANLPGVSDDDVNDNAIKTAMDKVMKAQIPILLVVLKTKLAAIYARVKYWGDTTYGRFSRLIKRI